MLYYTTSLNCSIVQYCTVLEYTPYAHHYNLCQTTQHARSIAHTAHERDRISCHLSDLAVFGLSSVGKMDVVFASCHTGCSSWLNARTGKQAEQAPMTSQYNIMAITAMNKLPESQTVNSCPTGQNTCSGTMISISCHNCIMK